MTNLSFGQKNPPQNALKSALGIGEFSPSRVPKRGNKGKHLTNGGNGEKDLSNEGNSEQSPTKSGNGEEVPPKRGEWRKHRAYLDKYG
ncbi:hypothetical protein FACS18949_05320 [Clostridia bacterium]|nr:hypothetical protein FACS18949_05320 [Clostridia bacterium]